MPLDSYYSTNRASKDRAWRLYRLTSNLLAAVSSIAHFTHAFPPHITETCSKYSRVRNAYSASVITLHLPLFAGVLRRFISKRWSRRLRSATQRSRKASNTRRHLSQHLPP